MANAPAAPNLSTLIAAIKAAGLSDILADKGMCTIFAPNNTAFEKLPDGSVAMLLQPKNKVLLINIVTHHVVARRMTSTDIIAAIMAGFGKATLTTVGGDTLSVRLSGNSIVITDGKGGQSAVTTVDIKQSNGIVHVIDSVLLPHG